MSGIEEREKRRNFGVAAAMISSPVSVPIQPEPIQKRNGNDGRGRPKAQREIKKRISLAVLPSVYAAMQKIAHIERSSTSEIVSEFFEQYIRDNAAKIDEYDRLYGD